MNRLTIFGVATAAAALTMPAIAQDAADPERAFSRAARGFTACLAAAATTEEAKGSLDGKCLAQETAYRESGMRLRMARGRSETDAAVETEADIASGRRTFDAAQARRIASAH